MVEDRGWGFGKVWRKQQGGIWETGNCGNSGFYLNRVFIVLTINKNTICNKLQFLIYE